MPLGVCLSLNKYYTKNTLALRRMLVFEQVVEASPRRGKHTPFNKK